MAKLREALKKNATDCTDFTDLKILTNDPFEMGQAGAEVGKKRRPLSYGRQLIEYFP
jgi:hypothetical protein